MPPADLKPPRRVRFWTAAGVFALHVLAAIAIVRAFTPDIASLIVDKARDVLTVVVSTPPPEAEPKPEPDSGASAPEAQKAKPREQSAPKQPLPKKPQPMPPVSGKGAENASGAAASGPGTGGGGEGTGTGSGAAGSGQGGGAARGVEKLAGEINSAKDYPKKTRDLRIGQSVTILLVVGTDGRVSHCQITQPSPDREADQITCQLATRRFRFRPAADRNGNPVEGRFAWRQRWFY
jgi:protein TonB